MLRNNSTIQHFKRNQLIYCEGDEPKDMMCLLKGKVKIFKDGVGGRSQIIRMIKPVQYFGYRANFAQEDYLTNASAFEPSTVCLIPMTVVKDLIYANPDLAMFFIRQLSVDLGIAIGSACAMAADMRVDTRVMFSAGLAAQRLGLLGDCKCVMAIPVSCSSKNPFFDRKPKA